MKKGIVEKKIWPGERVGYTLLREHLCTMLSVVRTSKLHYALTMPDFRRQPDNNFTMRICHFDHVPGKLTLQAAFDGILDRRDFSENDIFVGSFNSGNRVVDMESASYSGFSLVFHLQHIRLNYVVLENGIVRKNIYFHSQYASGNTLSRILNALDAVIHEHSDRTGRCRALLEAVVLQVLCDLDEETSAELHYDPPALRIKDYLESNFQHNINCSDVAEILGINRSYASTLFKKNFAISMNSYLLKLRLEAARYLLGGENNLKMREISELCAFSDVGYFTRVFRNFYGITPGEFRKNRTLNDPLQQ